MKASTGAVMRSASTAIGVATAWSISFLLNGWLFSFTQFTHYANWVFMPAALRLIAVLLFDEIGALGLVIGAFLTMPDKSFEQLLPQALVSVSSGLAPFVTVRAGRRLLGIPQSLRGLRTFDIIALSIGCAAANAIILNACLWLIGDLREGLKHSLSVFVGDVAGAALVLFVLSTALALVLPRSRSAAAPLPTDAPTPWG